MPPAGEQDKKRAQAPYLWYSISILPYGMGSAISHGFSWVAMGTRGKFRGFPWDFPWLTTENRGKSHGFQRFVWIHGYPWLSMGIAVGYYDFPRR